MFSRILTSNQKLQSHVEQLTTSQFSSYVASIFRSNCQVIIKVPHSSLY